VFSVDKKQFAGGKIAGSFTWARRWLSTPYPVLIYLLIRLRHIFYPHLLIVAVLRVLWVSGWRDFFINKLSTLLVTSAGNCFCDFFPVSRLHGRAFPAICL